MQRREKRKKGKLSPIFEAEKKKSESSLPIEKKRQGVQRAKEEGG